MQTEQIVVWDGRRGWAELYGDAGRGYIVTEAHPVMSAPDVVREALPVARIWTATDSVMASMDEQWRTVKEIAEKAGSPEASTAKRVSALVRDGYIERRLVRLDPNGRRGTTIRAFYRAVLG